MRLFPSEAAVIADQFFEGRVLVGLHPVGAHHQEIGTVAEGGGAAQVAGGIGP